MINDMTMINAFSCQRKLVVKSNSDRLGGTLLYYFSKSGDMLSLINFDSKLN